MSIPGIDNRWWATDKETVADHFAVEWIGVEEAATAREGLNFCRQ